jgi:hypothetical protein
VHSRPVVIAAVSDVHAGSAVALCPPVVRLDDGGTYGASPAQSWLWQGWNDFWKEADATRQQEDAEFYGVFNGDLVDGQVKNSTQILSANPNAQAAVVTAAIAVPLALDPDRIIIVRGTEAHVGNSASAEERIADGLRRDKRPIISDPDTGTASWWHWRAEIQGVRLDVTHHGRTGMREHTRGSAAVLHAHDILLSHVKAGHPYPHLCLRAHHHKFNDSHDSCPVRVVTTGAWQLATGFVKKVAADSLSDIGGVIITIRNGEYDLRKVRFYPERPIWRPEAA